MSVFRQGQRKSDSGAHGKSSNVPWTPAEIESALMLFDDDHSMEDIAEAIGRTVVAVTEKVTRELRKREIEETGIVRTRSRISERLQQERELRHQGNDARDFTAAFFGDPPRGFSALDKQRGDRG